MMEFNNGVDLMIRVGLVSHLLSQLPTGPFVSEDLVEVRHGKLTFRHLLAHDLGEGFFFSRELVVGGTKVFPEFVQEIAQYGLQQNTRHRKDFANRIEAVSPSNRAIEGHA